MGSVIDTSALPSAIFYPKTIFAIVGMHLRSYANCCSMHIVSASLDKTTIRLAPSTNELESSGMLLISELSIFNCAVSSSSLIMIELAKTFGNSLSGKLISLATSWSDSLFALDGQIFSSVCGIGTAPVDSPYCHAKTSIKLFTYSLFLIPYSIRNK